MMLLMSIFGIYCGFIYNEFFSVPMNLFGSRFECCQSDNLTYFIREGFEERVYPIGVDPVWKGAGNELLYYNSLKMKNAIMFVSNKNQKKIKIFPTKGGNHREKTNFQKNQKKKKKPRQFFSKSAKTFKKRKTLIFFNAVKKLFLTSEKDPVFFGPKKKKKKKNDNIFEKKTKPKPIFTLIFFLVQSRCDSYVFGYFHEDVERVAL